MSAPDLTIEGLRRERRLLARLRLAARVLGFAHIGLFIVFAMVLHRLEPAFVALSLSGTLTNLSTLLIHGVSARPALVIALIDPRPDVRARAAAIIEAHRHEVLATTDLPAHMNEPDLVAMDIDAITRRVAANAPYGDWRRIGRWWLAIWAVGYIAVTVAIIDLA